VAGLRVIGTWPLTSAKDPATLRPMNASDTIEFFTANPRATAKEAGITTAEANLLVGQGKLMQAGNRVTGQRGRPPMEYVVAGTVMDDDGFSQRQVEAARDRLRINRSYERMSNAIMRAANEFGHGSTEHIDAKLLRLETFVTPPALPSKNDYVLAGEFVDEPGEDE
jgi:hypothetical protein